VVAKGRANLVSSRRRWYSGVVKNSPFPRVSCFSALVFCLAATAFAATPGAPTAGAGSAAEAAYQFTLAKMLAEDGRMLEALQVYPEAVAAAPEDPYVRIEYASLLLRVAQRYGAGPGRLERLTEAVDQAETARRLAPRNVEALKALGQVQLSLSEVDGEALGAAIESFEQVREKAPWDLQIMVTLGQIYMQQQRPERAAEVFSEVSRYTPDNRIVYSLYADALRAAGDDQRAEGVLRKLVELDPGALDSRMALVKILARRGDHHDAVAVLRAAPEEPGGGREVHDELVWQLYLAGDLDEALREVEAVPGGDEEGVWSRFVRSLILSGLDRNEEALAELDALRATDPDNLELARTAAGVLERDGRPEEAARILGELLSRLEQAADDEASREARTRARFLLAGILARSDRRAEAVATLRPLLDAADPQVRAEAGVAYAELLFESGDREAALASLEGAELPELHAKQVELLMRAGQEKKAKKILARISREGDAEQWARVAQALQGQQRYELSLPLLERAMESGPPRVDVQFLAGAAYERTGHRQAAIETFRRLLQADPDFAPALNYLGYMFVEKGENLDEATELVRRAVAIDPDNGAYVDSLGWAMFQRGDYVEARRYLERAADLIPDDATICEHLADVYAMLGETDRAAAYYQKALELAADDAAGVQRKLERLRVD
jgi:tetratricopeptide (TPR) repeat protein